MARLVTSGAEWGELIAEGISSGSPAFVTSPVRSGSFSFQPAGPTPWSIAGVLGTTYFIRGYVNWDGTAPSASSVLLLCRDSGNAGLGYINLETDGTLNLKFGGTSGTTLVGSASVALTLNTWQRVELSVLIGTGAVDALEGRLDGTTFASGSSLTISDNVPSTGGLAPGGTSGHLWVDDFAINDSTGAAQNSWPGSGKVVLLKPISDSAVGTGWTLGTGTAIAGGTGSTAVKNTPPLGVADLTAGSDVKQIRNASSNANVNYDANMTSYTTAGVGASDTINVLVPMVATGAPVVTSAKAGTFGVASNPAITNVSLSAGGTSGAFWAGAGAGTYPTGWKWTLGTTTYAPTVTKGTSPVARITQVTASTRIADVCAMGIYVDYTPGPKAPPPHRAPLAAVTTPSPGGVYL